MEGQAGEIEDNGERIEITLKMLHAGVAAFLRWDGATEEPEALVWSICEAALAAREKRTAASSTAVLSPTPAELRLQGDQCRVTMSVRSPRQVAL